MAADLEVEAIPSGILGQAISVWQEPGQPSTTQLNFSGTSYRVITNNYMRHHVSQHSAHQDGRSS